MKSTAHWPFVTDVFRDRARQKPLTFPLQTPFHPVWQHYILLFICLLQSFTHLHSLYWRVNIAWCSFLFSPSVIFTDGSRRSEMITICQIPEWLCGLQPETQPYDTWISHPGRDVRGKRPLCECVTYSLMLWAIKWFAFLVRARLEE